VLLEVLLAGASELDGDKLEATVLEALDDGADEAALVLSCQLATSLAIMGANGLPGRHPA
jgi:hypothetical protein